MVVKIDKMIDKMVDEIREWHGKIQNREVDESIAVIATVPLKCY